MGSYFRDYMDRKASQRPTIGDTKFSAVSSDHMGWLKCDGRSLSVADYNLLFQVIGYAFGGSGTTFRLPDSQGRVPGAIGSNGESTWALGDVSGSETNTLTIAQMPAHNHGTNASDTVPGNNLTGVAGSHDHGGSTSGLIGGSNIVNGTENVYNSLTPLNAVVNAGEGTHDHTISTDGAHQHSIATQGGGDPHNNIQPTIFMGSLYMYCGRVSVGNWPYTTGTNIL